MKNISNNFLNSFILNYSTEFIDVYYGIDWKLVNFYRTDCCMCTLWLVGIIDIYKSHSPRYTKPTYTIDTHKQKLQNTDGRHSFIFSFRVSSFYCGIVYKSSVYIYILSCWLYGLMEIFKKQVNRNEKDNSERRRQQEKWSGRDETRKKRTLHTPQR